MFRGFPGRALIKLRGSVRVCAGCREEGWQLTLGSRQSIQKSCNQWHKLLPGCPTSAGVHLMGVSRSCRQTGAFPVWPRLEAWGRNREGVVCSSLAEEGLFPSFNGSPILHSPFPIRFVDFLAGFRIGFQSGIVFHVVVQL